MTIEYRVGDATRPVGDGHKLIVHVCNDRGGWGAGFTGALSRRWPGPERAYRTWALSGAPRFCMSDIQIVCVEPDIRVANMIAQRGVPGDIVYEALKICLMQVAEPCFTHGWSVHMPRIGCGLAGGSWDKVEPIVAETLEGLSVTVYDLKG